MKNIHVFTSVTSNYIPKAKVLAESVKKFHPDFCFHLILSDHVPKQFSEEDNNYFDSIITVEDLPIPNLKSWIFKHDIVELCTAVKAISFQEIARRYECEKIIYLDPDTVVFSKLDELVSCLDEFSIVLTPHFCLPQTTEESISHYEISALKHGVYNLGFLAVRLSDEGINFINWWNDRLLNFCYDEIARGLFTDQKWIDFVPVFFTNVCILKKSNYNVAIWNLTQRKISGSVSQEIFVDDLPLVFYHFTGFDNKVDIAMFEKYNLSKLVLSLRNWYEKKIQDMGQSDYGKTPCVFSSFDNGDKITSLQRMIYRNNIQLQSNYPDPFNTQNKKNSFYNWLQENSSQNPDIYTYEDLSNVPIESVVSLLRAKIIEIESYKSSKFWKMREFYWQIKSRFFL
jgi:lipopolysaccharide biosynthesis glycosyltransferase